MQGENNPRYSKKLLVKCNNCGKEFYRKPSTALSSNKNGDIHNFCTPQCYYSFRKNTMSEISYITQVKKMNKDFCDKVRNATLRQYSNGIINRQTKPQKIVNRILEENRIQYENEKIFGYYSVDNYLVDYNLIIEVMGDYFHANPIMYNNYNSLNKMQIKDVHRDKRKHTYISNYHKIEILYLWESDIKNNTEMCTKLILDYIDNKGKLDNYNSFNFYLLEGKIKLIKNIINPYFINSPLTTKL